MRINILCNLTANFINFVPMPAVKNKVKLVAIPIFILLTAGSIYLINKNRKFKENKANDRTEHCAVAPKTLAQEADASDEVVRDELSVTGQYFDWRNRPEAVKKQISEIFSSLVDRIPSSAWRSYGMDKYSVCNVNEYALIKTLILNASAKQEHFYIMDLGAGEFQWNEGVVNFLNSDSAIPDNVTIHVIGVRAEKLETGKLSSIEQRGKCRVYKFGAFNIENLQEELIARGLSADFKIDMAISNLCLCHLTDPIGAVKQVYDKLREKTGFFLTDGFRVGGVSPKKVTEVFLSTKAPFITSRSDYYHGGNQYVLRKPDHLDCRLPFQYTGALAQFDARGDMFPVGYVGFPEKTALIALPQSALSIGGSKELYEWLKVNHLLRRGHWFPLTVSDKNMRFPLHAAIENNDFALISSLLCIDHLNESDLSGNTPLHLSIKHKNFSLFQRLLAMGADLTLHNGEDYSLLHQAAAYDTEGRFLAILLQKNLPINDEANSVSTPLAIAMESENEKAIALLREAGGTE